MAAKKKATRTKPGECCEVMKMVLAEENPGARSGFSVPFMVMSRDELQLKPPQITYKATGRGARVIFINFCPFCGKKQGA